tara:strand:- start:3769 stop:4362 length:594 start_codon:yes stop_codon:yes gene_type:complete
MENPMHKSQSVPPHAFDRCLAAVRRMSPCQIEELLERAVAIRSSRLALGVIEARGDSTRNCPHCGHDSRKKWGTTRTGAQRFRCAGCGRTWSGLTGTRVCGLRHLDQLLEVVEDMLSVRAPSCRKLGKKLGRRKDTIWRWGMLILSAISGASSERFDGIVEVDEAYRRESRKGSREWVRHSADPDRHPRPPRLQWHR